MQLTHSLQAAWLQPLRRQKLKKVSKVVFKSNLYRYTELLQLIHEHLSSAGLRTAAAALLAETQLGGGGMGAMVGGSPWQPPPDTGGGGGGRETPTPRLTGMRHQPRRPGASAAGLFEVA